MFLAGKRDEVEERGEVKRGQNAEQVVDPVQRDPQAALQDPSAKKQDQIRGDRQPEITDPTEPMEQAGDPVRRPTGQGDRDQQSGDQQPSASTTPVPVRSEPPPAP